MDARLSHLVASTLDKFWEEHGTGEEEEVREHTLLDEQLWMDDLALEDLCILVNKRLEPSRPVALQSLEGCRTAGELARALEAALRGSALRGAQRFLTASVWLEEYCGGEGAAAAAEAELLRVPRGLAGNPERAMVRLRRTYEQVGARFKLEWRELQEDARRDAILACAPIPLGQHEGARFPASLALVPEVTLDALVARDGEALVELLERRCTEDYARLNLADMEHCRRIKGRFACPAEWERKVMVMETREVIKVETDKDEARVRDRLNAGVAVSGLLWSLYLARAISKTSFLQSLLDACRKRAKKMSEPLKKDRVAPNPGKCSHCAAVTEELRRCGACKLQWYCSRECQAKAWPEHRPNCKKPTFALKLQ